MAFIPYCSLPELEACMEVWGFMEMIHSRSYTYIIKNIYPDPSDIFDHIITDDRILERAKSVTESYDDFINSAQQWGNGNMWKEDFRNSPSSKWEIKDVKRKLFEQSPTLTFLRVLGSTLVLACSFAFGELKVYGRIGQDHLSYRKRREPTPSNHPEHPEQVEIG